MTRFFQQFLNFEKIRILKDRFAEKSLFVFMLIFGLALFLIILVLFLRTHPIHTMMTLPNLLFSTVWKPSKGLFGFLPFIAGSLWVTGVAMAIAIPICLLTSLYLVEYAPAKLRELISPLIDILAGIPSVVYGIWGVLAIVPFIKNYLAPLFGISSTGYSIAAGGIVLAIMVFPVIIHISVEILKAVPKDMKDASLALGATKWQTIKHVVMKRAMPGIVAAIVLALSRAFGETIAVLMVVGNVARIPKSLFDPAYPLPALIANNYGEMLSIPMYDSALLFAALLLLLVVLYFNIISRMILSGSKWSSYYYG
ncbi:MAG: phosphate ABC transporter permease subunit PstC [Candidatus Omnitrophica bacterium]|nr:phosphate ABC transporter permease subunit PstC [Candidatus Omnitrophota bacterium]